MRRGMSAVRLAGPPCAVLLTVGLILPSSALACVVGMGTPASCNETALDNCLPGGGSFNGSVTFNCGVPATMCGATSPERMPSTAPPTQLPALSCPGQLLVELVAAKCVP